MKKRWYPLLLAPLALLLGGCINMEETITIVNDDEINITIDLSMSKEFAKMMQITDLCTMESFGEMMPSTRKLEPYSESENIGCRAMYTTNITDASMDFGITLTHVDGEYHFAMYPENGIDTGGMGEIEDVFSIITVKVKFPGSVTSHNLSSTVSGTTVTWSSISDILSTEGLQASGSDTATFPWLMVIGIAAGAAVLGVGGFVGYRMIRKRKAQAAAQQAQNAYYYQQQYAAQQGYGYPGYGQPQPYPPQPVATSYGTPPPPPPPTTTSYETPSPAAPYATPTQPSPVQPSTPSPGYFDPQHGTGLGGDQPQV
ncbi:MAG: hypothetical protein LBH11_04735 [Propionibacteriaceae bacterium]|jgi:type II secretory pathway pseudopilin PulG|nr:hypothetical protein [Propionibacteriaceae bacterium]